MFEFVEAAFDSIALFVEFAVIGALLFAVAFGRDDRHRAYAFRLRQQSIGIVAAVGDDSLGLPIGQQLRGRRILAGLSRGDAELERQTVLVGQQMDLGAQTSSGTPQSRVFAAPFLRPVAACWCARTMVESIIRY